MSTFATDNEIDPLTLLAIRHGTDKWGPHFYTPVYDELFSHLRDRPIRLLEIGVGGYDLRTMGGASLAMWADYFQNGEITGIDPTEKRLTLDPRIKVLQGSQDDPAFLKEVCEKRGPFDIIIDDGSHIPKHMVGTFNVLFPSLADGGTYVIEDMQTAFWPHFGGSMLHGGEIMKLVRTIIECLNHAEIGIVDRSHTFPSFAKQVKSFRACHNLLIIEKGNNDEPSNYAYDLNNARAATALRLMERELEGEPTVEGLANLSNLYLVGGNVAKAKEVAERALSIWPENAIALMAAYFVAKRQNNTTAKVNYLERILQIEPDNPAVQQITEQARAELKQKTSP